jgi:antitoxin component YwqK of YwqJK toxin-antitoxin module
MFYVFIAITIHAQNTDDHFYLFKKNWTSAKDVEHAVYFMQMAKENDTSYKCLYYSRDGSMLRQEVYFDSAMQIPNGRFCWYDANGNLDSTGWVYHKMKDSAWTYYDDSIKPVITYMYNRGGLVKTIKGHTENNYNEEFFVDDFQPAVFGTLDSNKQWKEFLKRI